MARGEALAVALRDLLDAVGHRFELRAIRLVVAEAFESTRTDLLWTVDDPQCASGRPGPIARPDAQFPFPIENGTEGFIEVWFDDPNSALRASREMLLDAMATTVSLAIVRDELARRFEAAFDHATIGFTCRAADGHLLDCNRAYADLVGSTVEELIGGTPPDVVHPDDYEMCYQRVRQMLSGEIDNLSFEYRMRPIDSPTTDRWVRSTSSAVRWPNGDLRYLMAVFEDVTERRASEQAVRDSEARYRGLIEHAPMVVLSIAHDDRIVFASAEVRSSLGIDPFRLEQRHFSAIGLGADEVTTWTEALQRVRATGADEEVETRVVTPEGDRWLSGRLAPGDRPGAVTAYAFDVTQRHRLQAQIERAASHDTLTGLANRATFLYRVDDALSRQRRNGRSLAVVFVDLDRFKVVNDMLGHAAGDEVLIGVAKRITTAVREVDTVGRLGGDEFVVLLEDCLGAEGAALTAERIRQVLLDPLPAGGQEVYVTASLGVVVHPGGPTSADELVGDSDRAMYRAKRNGRDRIELFDEALRAEVAARVATEGALRRALPRGEFELYIQPEVDLVSRRIVGGEALVRWNHPERGLLAAAEFVELAEESGVILDLDPWIIAETAACLGRWRGAGLDVRCRVNLSRRTVLAPGLVDQLAECLRVNDLDPSALGVELTETALVSDSNAIVRTLAAIRQLGISVAIDDFGTGYSSLGMLRSMSVDALKLDRSFVSGLPDEHGADAIVSTVMMLAQSLGLVVVAEGVETEAQAERLIELGCQRAQGWLFSKAIPASQFVDLVS